MWFVVHVHKKGKIGYDCADDGACESDRCDTFFTCTPKKENVEKCGNDGQRESSDCGWDFKCSHYF